MSAEDHLEDAQRGTLMAAESWHGPQEAQEHLLQAMAHLSYADWLWRTMEERR